MGFRALELKGFGIQVLWDVGCVVAEIHRGLGLRGLDESICSSRRGVVFFWV